MQNKVTQSQYALVSLAILSSIIIWIYWPILTNMILYLMNEGDYSYGLLLPIVSAYIVYQKWPQIRQMHWQPSWWGLLIIISGLFLNIVGELAADLYVPRVSFVITLGGIIYLLAGWRMVRLLIFPLILLWLMIPLPDLITKAVTMPLQLVSSQLAAGMLQMMGIPVLRQGNIIDLGVRQMQVVDACSGLRYILALLALGVIFCYFYQRKPWKILILILVLIPATIFANALRVAGMGLYPALLEGFWHGFSGWLIFIFCFGILAVVNFLLNRLSPPSEIAKLPSDFEIREEFLEPNKSSAYWIYPVAAAVIMILFVPLMNIASYAPNYPIKEGLANFPLTIDSWKGRHAYIDPDMVAATKSSDHLNAEYTNPQYGWVSLWIAYYETQKKAGGFVHSPKGCFTASGWQIEKSKVIDIAKDKPINWMVVNRMGEKLLVYYWFLQRGRWLADETINKFYMAYDGFVRRRTDGAMVRLITPIGGNLEAAQQRLTLFAENLMPILNQYIPD